MSKGNLLIIDDEPDIRMRLSDLLEEYAEKIYVAANGKEGLETFNSHEIHCIICDINMPEMNGVELIKALRTQGTNTPFIFYTAHGNRDLMLEAVKYGAFDFLDKPNLNGLEDVISRGLAHGFNMGEGTAEEDAGFVSDYQELLRQLPKDE